MKIGYNNQWGIIVNQYLIIWITIGGCKMELYQACRPEDCIPPCMEIVILLTGQISTTHLFCFYFFIFPLSY